MEYGILIGAGVHLLLLAYMGNRPHPTVIKLPVGLLCNYMLSIDYCYVHQLLLVGKFPALNLFYTDRLYFFSPIHSADYQENDVTEERVIVKADANLYFPGVEKFRRALNKATEADDEGRVPCLMIDLSSLKEIDYSALKVSEREKRNIMTAEKP